LSRQAQASRDILWQPQIPAEFLLDKLSLDEFHTDELRPTKFFAGKLDPAEIYPDKFLRYNVSIDEFHPDKLSPP
jgi:hypothetical protein